MSLTKAQAKREITAFVDACLHDYVARTPRVKRAPGWVWTNDYPPAYAPGVQVIYVTEFLMTAFWMYDRTKTAFVLRFTLAHEFHHYVQESSMWRQFVGTIRGIDYQYSERAANMHAARLSGITPQEHDRLLEDLFNALVPETRVMLARLFVPAGSEWEIEVHPNWARLMYNAKVKSNAGCKVC